MLFFTFKRHLSRLNFMVRKYLRENAAIIGLITGMLLLMAFMKFDLDLAWTPDVGYPGSDKGDYFLTSRLEEMVLMSIPILLTAMLIPFNWKYSHRNALMYASIAIVFCVPEILDGVLILMHLDHTAESGMRIVSWVDESEYEREFWMNNGRTVFYSIMAAVIIVAGIAFRIREKEMNSSIA